MVLSAAFIQIHNILEFELKAKVESEADVASLLADLSFTGEQSQVDEYFDTLDRQLYPQGMFLRVRDSRFLQLKYSSDPSDVQHLECHELSIKLPGQPDEVKDLASRVGISLSRDLDPPMTFESMKSAFDLHPFVTLRKHRRTFSGPGVEVVLDRVQMVGTFIEIEVLDPQLRGAFLERASQLGLQHIPAGYVELLVRILDYGTYLRGKYVLPEDRLAGATGTAPAK